MGYERRIGIVLLLCIGSCAEAPAPRAPKTERVAPTPPPKPEPPPPAPPPPDLLNEPPPEPIAPPPPPPPPPVPAPTSDPKPSAAEIKACAARGGTLQPVCMMGKLDCVVRYRDGGKRCTDKKDCTGDCLYEGSGPPPAANAVGACQRTSDPCGCKAPIVRGRVGPALCVD